MFSIISFLIGKKKMLGMMYFTHTLTKMIEITITFLQKKTVGPLKGKVRIYKDFHFDY